MIITVFLLSAQLVSAQKIFQQPRAISQLVGRMNYENKKWAYQNSPQYVKNVAFNYYTYGCYGSLEKNLNKSYNTFLFNRQFYFDRLSFFCWQEYKFEKYSKIPLRVRVGSLDYTNYLEKKLNAVKPQF